MRRKKIKIKNVILKALAYSAGIVAMVSACAVDSESPLPAVTLVVSVGYLLLFALANGWVEL